MTGEPTPGARTGRDERDERTDRDESTDEAGPADRTDPADSVDRTDPADSVDRTASEFRIPRGDLLRSRVVTDVGTPLATALDRELTGYATVVPQETLLLSGETLGVITFADGVPVLAYDAVSGAGGPEALAELAVTGPFRVELYAVDAPALAEAHDADALRVPPGAPATQLADDPALADRAREAAPDDRLADDEESGDAVASFLDDDERIDAIRERAREEARDRAAEWGLDDALAEPSAGRPSPERDV